MLRARAVAGDSALALHVAAMAYCSSHETDGELPALALPTLCSARRPEGVAEALVRAGLWQVIEGGYRLVDYLKGNSSHEQIEQRRAKTRERVARYDARSRQVAHGVNDTVSGSTPNGAANASANAVSNAGDNANATHGLTEPHTPDSTVQGSHTQGAHTHAHAHEGPPANVPPVPSKPADRPPSSAVGPSTASRAPVAPPGRPADEMAAKGQPAATGPRAASSQAESRPHASEPSVAQLGPEARQILEALRRHPELAAVARPSFANHLAARAIPSGRLPFVPAAIAEAAGRIGAACSGGNEVLSPNQIAEKVSAFADHARPPRGPGASRPGPAVQPSEPGKSWLATAKPPTPKTQKATTP
jgi:hypothetical protein